MVKEFDSSGQKSQRQVSKLSVIVPSFNEGASLLNVVCKLSELELEFEHEIIVIDDGSTDASFEQIIETHVGPAIIPLKHEVNLGKGSAVLTGLGHASGSHVVIFDADDEYNPEDLSTLAAAFAKPRVEAVYGSRMHSNNTRHPSLIHKVGNRVMTLAANLIYASAMTDIHTCLKMFPIDLIRDFKLTEKGFGLDTEITSEMLRRGIRPFEVQVSYNGRSRSQGKKIHLSDSIRCFWLLVKVKLRGSKP